jgi:hypothetical protein
MRRILIASGMAFAFALSPVGVAAAQGARHHRRHHHHVHFITFAKAHHATTTTTPTTPTTTPTESVATIVSFTEGVLTIKLADGSTVAGKVTEATEVQCFSSAGEEQNHEQGEDQGADNGDSSGQAGGPGPSQSHGEDMSGGQSGDQGDDNVADEQGRASCTSSALVAGAVVGEAELKVTGAGSVWERVQLIG